MTFEITLHAKNFLVDDRLNKYIIKKIPKLDRYMKGIIDARVDLSFHKSAKNTDDRHVAQITLRGNNFILRAEERTDDIYASFDSAMDKIRRRIERYKGKHYRGPGDRNSIRNEEFVLEEDGALQESQSDIIIRRKKFVLKPMREMEAIEQMNLLGHEDFFLFFNADTGAVNVLYRRRNKGYGIIETDME
ncbi:MAG: ribosome-associated translation inhibitor RaiA [Chloroflexi bacterium]|nr:ribosome-associated translation inhibitor RaiA [Chloroflexota bacterium]